jgi:hypothetical protein
MKTRVALLALLMTLAAPAALRAQNPPQGGTVGFYNTASTLITNCHTRLPQPAHTVKYGLYYTVDLSAVSNAAARASMLPTVISSNSPIDGRFAVPLARLPLAPPESYVVLQVKVWPMSYGTFEEARAALAEVAESLPWIQKTGGGIVPPPVIHRWGFRPFLYPQCEQPRVPLFVERGSGNSVRVAWPAGVPPHVQVLEAGSTNWVSLTNGVFVTDHWQFETAPTTSMRLFRIAQ